MTGGARIGREGGGIAAKTLGVSNQDPCVRWLAAQVAAVAPGVTVDVSRSPRGYYAVTVEGRPGVLRVDADWLLGCMGGADEERVRRQIRLHLEESDL